MHVCCVDIKYVPYKWQICEFGSWLNFSSIAKLPIIFQQGIVGSIFGNPSLSLINLPN